MRKNALSACFVSLVHMAQIETIGVVLPKVAKVISAMGILAKVFVAKFANVKETLIKKLILMCKSEIKYSNLIFLQFIIILEAKYHLGVENKYLLY